ncbi:Hypothetical protein D9617_39g039080 [Elsinoe fawcettii]|nr:Hypothetical protein D9617_39g039080 [Elsinoe fawcettii]
MFDKPKGRGCESTNDLQKFLFGFLTFGVSIPSLLVQAASISYPNTELVTRSDAIRLVDLDDLPHQLVSRQVGRHDICRLGNQAAVVAGAVDIPVLPNQAAAVWTRLGNTAQFGSVAARAWRDPNVSSLTRIEVRFTQRLLPIMQLDVFVPIPDLNRPVAIDTQWRFQVDGPGVGEFCVDNATRQGTIRAIVSATNARGNPPKQARSINGGD